MALFLHFVFSFIALISSIDFVPNTITKLTYYYYMLVDYICVQILYFMSYHIPLSNQPQDDHMSFFWYSACSLLENKVFFFNFYCELWSILKIGLIDHFLKWSFWNEIIFQNSANISSLSWADNKF